MRVDTGLVGRFKGFASVSQSHVRKWKGPGVANRDHVDAGASYDLGGGNVVTASMLFNRELNNNFLALTPAQFAQWVASKGGTMPGSKPPAPDSTAISPVTPSSQPPPAARPQPPQPGSGDATRQPAVNQAATAQN